jgi:hypothetical protein
VNDPETNPDPPGPTVQVAPEPTTTDGAPKESPGNAKGTENDPVVVPGAIEITSVVSTLLPIGTGRSYWFGVNVALVAVLGGMTWMFVKSVMGAVTLSATGPIIGSNAPTIAVGEMRASKVTVQLLGPASDELNVN